MKLATVLVLFLGTLLTAHADGFKCEKGEASYELKGKAARKLVKMLKLSGIANKSGTVYSLKNALCVQTNRAVNADGLPSHRCTADETSAGKDLEGAAAYVLYHGFKEAAEALKIRLDSAMHKTYIKIPQLECLIQTQAKGESLGDARFSCLVCAPDTEHAPRE